MTKLIAIFALIAPVFAGADQVESILGFNVDSKGLTYQVASGGCTKKSDFKLNILETHPAQLVLVRTKVDACEAYLPYGVKLEWTWQELGGLPKGAQLTVSNPLAPIYIR
jgi:hypothetical protein